MGLSDFVHTEIMRISLYSPWTCYLARNRALRLKMTGPLFLADFFLFYFLDQHVLELQNNSGFIVKMFSILHTCLHILHNVYKFIIFFCMFMNLAYMILNLHAWLLICHVCLQVLQTHIFSDFVCMLMDFVYKFKNCYVTGTLSHCP